MKISTKDYSSQYDQIWKVESGKWKVHIPPGFLSSGALSI